MATRIVCFFALVLLGFAAGCSSATGPEETGSSPPPAKRCSGGAVSPVQVEDLVRVFRAHGLMMFNDPGCATTTAERQASNMPIWGPDSHGLDEDAINASQGHVVCLFDASAHWPVQPVIENRYAGDEETTLEFGNVTCYLYPGSDESERAQLRRLRTATNALAREVAARSR